MKNVRHSLLSTAAVIPLALGVAAGMAVVGNVATGGMGSAIAACNPCNPCAAAKACNPCNPCAAKKACNPCNPCGAKKACNPCNPCNPCGAKKACNPCNPCNPCSASACNPCNPCNPCGAGGGSVSKSCFVPRLKTAAACNPCAAKACNPCNPCNPCGAKKACNPCNPCSAAKACNPCNPCGAKKACNPCNPCGAAKACNPCNPCGAKKACNPCNPCSAAKACNPCNPCAAKKACNPCNPCAASACNPCNPCNPCAAAPEVELTAAELKAVYDCLKPEMVTAYGNAPALAAKRWGKWERFSSVSYRSDTHGGRLVNNYSNKIGKKAYGQYDAVKRMPIGSTLAKNSFVVNANGTVAMGPLFLMEKMTKGFNKATADWRYAMVMPNGTLFGITGGKNAAGLKFCHDCHIAAEDNDMMLFLPEEYRKK